MASDIKYFNFPVAQIPEIRRDVKRAMEEIMGYSVVNLAQKRGITNEEAGAFLGITRGALINVRASSCRENTRSMTSITVNRAFEFRDNAKSDFDVLCLCANLAIRSIVGKHSFSLCRKSFIFSRMSGCDTRINENLYSSYVKPLVGANGRRRWEAVRWILRSQYGVAFYAPPGCKGFYVSYELDEPALAVSVERMIRRKRRNKKGETLNRALHRMALFQLEISLE